MKAISRFLHVLWNILRSQVGALGTAEVRLYDWDGVSPLRLRHGWVDMYGDPYQVQYAPGQSYVASGWVDVRAMAELALTVHAVGLAAGTVGEVAVIFQGAYSVIDPILQFTRDDLVGSVTVNGTTEQTATVVMDVSGLSFLRVYGCDNRANADVKVRVTAPDSAKPITV